MSVNGDADRICPHVAGRRCDLTHRAFCFRNRETGDRDLRMRFLIQMCRVAFGFVTVIHAQACGAANSSVAVATTTLSLAYFHTCSLMDQRRTVPSSDPDRKRCGSVALKSTLHTRFACSAKLATCSSMNTSPMRNYRPEYLYRPEHLVFCW